jgi:hydroxymethylpyrimidine pyrophosphatase-like HAD family hydrolase
LKQTTGIEIDNKDLIYCTINDLLSVWYLLDYKEQMVELKNNDYYITCKGRYIFNTNEISYFFNLDDAKIACDDFKQYLKLLVYKVNPHICIISSPCKFKYELISINNLSFLDQRYLQLESGCSSEYFLRELKDYTCRYFCDICGIELLPDDYYYYDYRTELQFCIFCFEEYIKQEIDQKRKLMNTTRLDKITTARLARKLL